jgi:hypothetical protein
MKRFIVGAVICSLTGLPIHAQDGGRVETGAVSSPDAAAGGRLDLHAIIAEKATAVALQVPQGQQPARPPAPAPTGVTYTKSEKVLYAVTLAGAAAGVIYNITTTRDALDHHLQARTFPLVWKKTSDPGDKGQVTGIIAASNAALLTVGALVFRNGNAPLATFLNVIVAGGTTIAGLRNRSIINDCEDKGTCNQ